MKLSMAKIESQPDRWSSCIKVGSNSKHKPVPLTDDSVYDLAQHYYTVEEIASHFNTSAETVLAHHGDAFRAGKENAHQKPRMILNQFFKEVLERDTLLGPEILDLGDGKKVVRNLDLHAVKAMMEFHAKKYEGMGKETPPPAAENKSEVLVVIHSKEPPKDPGAV